MWLDQGIEGIFPGRQSLNREILRRCGNVASFKVKTNPEWRLVCLMAIDVALVHPTLRYDVQSNTLLMCSAVCSAR